MNAAAGTVMLLLWVPCIFSAGALPQPGDARVDLGAAQGCTAFCLDNHGYAIYGTNYDYVKGRHDGLIFVNKKNVSKSFPQPDRFSPHVGWISRYGSVSFNLIASQTPWGGMNEAGLVISLMRLEGSTCPEPDRRPWIQTHYWLQYMLDNCSTIEEVIATDSSMRTVSSGRVPHYLVCDRFGHCAAIEFLQGRMVTHSGTSLPVKALANTSYDGSIMEWHAYLEQKQSGESVPATGGSSRDRFIRAAERVATFRPADSETAVKTAFDILAEASGQNAGGPTPCWSIVFDAKNLRIYFRTIVHADVRTIDFHKLDFSCHTPVKMLDINEKLSGDISDQLKEYSRTMHLDHAVKAGAKWGLDMSPAALEELFKSYEAWPCD